MEIRRVVAGADRDGRSRIVSDELAPAAHSFTSLPGQGFAQMHPDFDPVRAGQEFGTYSAGLAATMEPDAPGMHTSVSGGIS